MPYKLTSVFHVLVLLVVLSTTSQSSVALTQNKTDDKVFDEDFKSRYDGKQYDYSKGKYIITKNTEEVGNLSDYENGNDPYIQEDKNVSEFNSNGSIAAINYFFILILIGAVVYLAYLLLNEGNTGWFSTKRNISLSDHQTFNVETANPNDFLTLINNAENDNDYRLAIRYYFLYILKTLSVKNIIKIEEDKTNSEYLREINNFKIQQKFTSALYLYNYTWYGEFDVNKFQYRAAKSKFNSFLKTLKK